MPLPLKRLCLNFGTQHQAGTALVTAGYRHCRVDSTQSVKVSHYSFLIRLQIVHKLCLNYVNIVLFKMINIISMYPVVNIVALHSMQAC